MAKIIVTACWILKEEKVIIDSDCCVFKQNLVGGTTVIVGKECWNAKETIEEICKLINEAEAQATNKKLDEILKNLETIIKKLEDIHDDMRFISEEVDALT